MIEVAASFPLQLYPVFFSVEEIMLPQTAPMRSLKTGIWRLVVIILICLISAAIPKFIFVINLTGAVGSSLVGIILPNLFWLKLFWNEVGTFQTCLNIFLASGGLFAMGAGIYAASNTVF